MTFGKLASVAGLVASVALAQQTPPTPPPPPPPTEAAAGSTAPGSANSAAAGAPVATATAGGVPNTLANAVQARTPEEQANQTGFQIITSLDHWLGMGTFVEPKYYSYLSANLTVQPQFLFGVKGTRLAASATLRASYEYTLPDNDSGRRFSPADIRLGLSAPAFFRDKNLTGISVTPSVGLVVPTSPESWTEGLITSLSVGAAATRSFSTPVGGVDLRLAVGGSRGFYASPVNSIKPTKATDTFGNLLVVCRTGEAACASAGMNPAWSLNIGGQVNWRVNGEVIIYGGYSFIKGWREAATTSVDQYTPQSLDSNGNPVARVGYGQSDRTSSFLGASYQMNEHYSLDLGLATVQTPLTATGQVRFPFFAFGSLADNSTTAYFTLTAAY